MRTSRKNFSLFVGILAMAMAAAPYFLAYLTDGDGVVFGGILINPLDGNSYFAKAYQGYLGSWKFKLPYTADPGEGAYFHSLYIFLGHLSRLTGLSIPFLFHASRLSGAGLLLAAMERYFFRVVEGRFQQQVAFGMSALALGIGWLAVPFNVVPADFWVVEGYPLLSSLATPHFALGLALITWLATPTQHLSARQFLLGALGTLLLGFVSPFGIAIAVLPWVGLLFTDLYGIWQEKKLSVSAILELVSFRKAAAIALGGIPMVLYIFLAIRGDPVLRGWDEQNITPAPAWWDILLALSPALVLSIWGVRRANPGMVSWVLLSLLLVVLPFNLQRRFMMGIYIPLAGLGAVGLGVIAKTARQKRLSAVLLSFFLFPGTALLLLILVFGTLSKDPALYLWEGELAAFEWIETELPEEALILAGPDTGLFIPAYTGRRVVYGHPFETLNAAEEKSGIQDFFQEADPAVMQAYLVERQVDYVFFGPRERALRESGLNPLSGYFLEYEESGVQIFSVVP